MRMQRMLWAGVCATAALLPATKSGAQMPVQVGLVVGAGGAFRGAVPAGAYYPNGLGYNILGGVRLTLPVLPVAIRFDAQYDAFSGPLSFYADRVYSATANAEYTVALPYVHPYLVGGFGYYRVTAGYPTPAETSTGPDEVNANINGTGVNGGVGLRSGVGGFGLFAEWRYHYIFASGPLNTSGHISYAPFTFGLML
jgi:hypothetical protein